MDKKYKTIITLVLDRYGLEHQSRICIEEMAELTKALCKWFRVPIEKTMLDTITTQNLRSDIIDEIADVQISLDEMIRGFDIGREVNERILYKIDRLRHRLEAQS